MADAAHSQRTGAVDGGFTHHLSWALQLFTQGEQATVEKGEAMQGSLAPATTAAPTGQWDDNTQWEDHFAYNGMRGTTQPPFQALSPLCTPATSSEHKRCWDMPDPLPTSADTGFAVPRAMAAPATTPPPMPAATGSPDLDLDRIPLGPHPVPDWPPSCAAPTAPTSQPSSTSASHLQWQDGGTQPSAHSPLRSDHKATATLVDTMFDFDLFAPGDLPLSTSLEEKDQDEHTAAHPSSPSMVGPGSHDTNRTHNHARQNGCLDQLRGSTAPSASSSSFSVTRSASSCSAASQANSDKPPRSRVLQEDSTTTWSSPCQSSARTSPDGQNKRHSDADGRAPAISTLPGRSAVNKRCMLEDGDIDFEKLARTREVARRSYRRRRTAELQRRERLNMRLTLLHKTKTALLAQRANLMTEREYLIHLLQSRMHTCS